MKEKIKYAFELAGATMLALIIIYILSWEIKWLVQMQTLSWQIKVAEVAKFTCDPFKSQHSCTATNFNLKWECIEK